MKPYSSTESDKDVSILSLRGHLALKIVSGYQDRLGTNKHRE
eukprot:COSAG06_NODE_63203_length_263_cov_0.548780_1_plen_41_part_10